jgi:hypothetical protein
MTAASAYAQSLKQGFPVKARADIEATFPELQFPGQIEFDREWMAPLPCEIAVLYDRLRRLADLRISHVSERRRRSGAKTPVHLQAVPASAPLQLFRAVQSLGCSPERVLNERPVYPSLR